MPDQLPLKDKTAIAGIGWTNFTRNSGTTVVNLAAEASLRAIADAGLEVQDIDGVITYEWVADSNYPSELITALNLQNVNYSLFERLGGAGTVAPLWLHPWPCTPASARTYWSSGP